MTHEWLEKIETAIEELEPGGAAPTCPSADDAFTDASGRFVTYPSATPVEVCDTTTGKFWEQEPSGVFFRWEFPANTFPAADHCTNDVGPGWRLPEVKELISLVDFSVGTPAAVLNAGPFEGVQSFFYWSATSNAAFPSNAWGVGFLNGFLDSSPKGNDIFVWCVRSAP